MKKISFNKTYRPFLITGWIALFMALFFKIFYPESNFDVSIYSTDFFMAYSVVWLSFSGYLFFLAAIYFYINKAGLRTKKWLVNSHYMFIVLFLFFFIVFSAFGNADVKKLTANIPLITLISIYSIVFLTDAILFLLGLLLLIINIFYLHRDKI